MGLKTYSDICENVARIGNYLIDESDSDWYELGHGWVMAGSGCESGRKKRLYSEYYVKIEQEIVYIIALLNSSEYANVGRTDMVAFGVSQEEAKDFFSDENIKEQLDEIDPKLAQQNFITVAGREAVEKFLSDFGYKAKISDTDSVEQTL